MKMEWLMLGLALAVSSVTSDGQNSTHPVQQTRPPHLILIVADDLGWNDVPWHNTAVISPHLQQLARAGLVLNRSYVQPICTPTRTALLTARYPFTLGRQNNVIYPLCPTGLSLKVTTLPQELKTLGYDTHAVGKWHLGFCKWDYVPTSRGFDTFMGFYGGSQDYYTHMMPAYMGEELLPAQLPDEEGVDLGCNGYDFRKNREVFRAAAGNYSAFQYSDRVAQLLQGRNPEVPMFLYMPFQSVHAPLQVPQKYTDLYPDVKDERRRKYLGMVTAMDEAVGKIVASLKTTGHYNNSVIVFTTDNGGPTVWGGNNWPLRGNKTTLWEGGTRGSAFIHSPLLATAGTVSNRMIHATDWYPTFLQLAGGTPPQGIDGVPQWEALNNPSQEDARDYFVYDIDDTHALRAAVRWGNYKLIVGDPGPSNWTPPPKTGALQNPILINSTLINTTLINTIFINSTLFNITLMRPTDDSVHLLHQPIGNISSFEDPGNKISAGKDVETNVASDAVLEEEREETITETENNYVFIDKAVNYLSGLVDERESNFIGMAKLKNQNVNTSIFNSMTNLQNLKLNRSFIEREKEHIRSRNKADRPRMWRLRERKRRYREEQQRLKTSFAISQKITDFKSVAEMYNSKINVQLYNVIDDPTEHFDISASHPSVVKVLMTRLHRELSRYAAKDVPANSAAGDPANFDHNWSPGWC